MTGHVLTRIQIIDKAFDLKEYSTQAFELKRFQSNQGSLRILGMNLFVTFVSRQKLITMKILNSSQHCYDT
jgi:hypothetical protein